MGLGSNHRVSFNHWTKPGKGQKIRALKEEKIARRIAEKATLGGCTIVEFDHCWVT
jgi:hypothetical protein